MPRTKGSKNKPKTVAVDYVAQIAEEQAAKDAAIAELANAETAVDDLMAQLADLKETVKAKKANIKIIDKAIAKLAAKKAKADAAAEAEAKKTEAQEMVGKLLADGMSVDEILEKLK